MKLISTAIFLFLISIIRAQSNTDSLFSIWENEHESDSTRLSAMHDFIWDEYLFSRPDTAYTLAEELLTFATEKKQKRQMAKAFNIKGVAKYFMNEFDTALVFYQESYNLNQEIENQNGMANALNNMGIINYSLGDYNKALENYEICLAIRTEQENEPDKAKTLDNIGNILHSKGNYIKAIEFHTKALQISEKINDENSIASIKGNIGTIYMDQKEYSKALLNFNESLALYIKLNNVQGLVNLYGNLGNLYVAIDSLEKGAKMFYKNIQIAEETGYLYALEDSYQNLGLIEFEKGNYIKALTFYNKSLSYSQEIGDDESAAASLSSIGNVYLLQKEYAKAITSASKSLEISKNIGTIQEIRNASDVLYRSYKQTNDFQKALDMFELYNEVTDSILSLDNQKAIIRQEYKYNYEKQAAADSVKTAEEKKVTHAKLTAQKAQIEKEKTQRYSLYGGISALFLFGGFMYNRFRITKKQKNIIEAQKGEVELQRELVEEKNQEITASITYAKRIQGAILPPQKLIKRHLPESFVLYKPKDIVAGDFYWMEALSVSTNSVTASVVSNVVLFAVADCTGHGVPGAMVSVVCNNALNRSVREYGLTSPGEILDKTREIVIQEFEKSEEDVKDGMDIALCSLRFDVQGSRLNKTSNPEPKTVALLQFAGAHNPLWIVRNDKLLETKADKQPIGKFDHISPFTTHEIELQKGDTLYIFSDGYADQFGGVKGKKFKSKSFKELLLSVQGRSVEEQQIIIDKTFEDWRGDLEQIDDVCIIGIKI